MSITRLTPEHADTYRALMLQGYAGNAGAQALYASCGFAPFGNEPMAVRLGHGYVSKVHMWCDLGKLPATSAGG